MAIDLGTTVLGERTGDRIVLRSHQHPEPAEIQLGSVLDGLTPEWARYVAAVMEEVKPDVGLVGVVDSTVPVGSGLSSSAALEVSVALALGYEGPPLELAAMCQRAEQRASGVPCGIM